jgi:hypothetical protein
MPLGKSSGEHPEAPLFKWEHLGVPHKKKTSHPMFPRVSPEGRRGETSHIEFPHCENMESMGDTPTTCRSMFFCKTSLKKLS